MASCSSETNTRYIGRSNFVYLLGRAKTLQACEAVEFVLYVLMYTLLFTPFFYFSSSFFGFAFRSLPHAAGRVGRRAGYVDRCSGGCLRCSCRVLARSGRDADAAGATLQGALLSFSEKFLPRGRYIATVYIYTSTWFDLRDGLVSFAQKIVFFLKCAPQHLAK